MPAYIVHTNERTTVPPSDVRALCGPRRSMPVDADSTELKVGDRVVDDIFGEGTVLGMVPLKRGVGLNVDVRWDSGHIRQLREGDLPST